MGGTSLLQNCREHDLPFLGTEDSAARTQSEIAYLRAALDELAPGRSVVEVGCGTGLRAIGLAAAGYGVTGFDPSPQAVREARRNSAGAAGPPRWEVVDPRAVLRWPVASADAVVWGRSFCVGSDADRSRQLGQARRLLAARGVLILNVPNGLCPAHRAEGERVTEVGGETVRMRKRYHPAEGRVRGEVTARGLGSARAFDVRLYSPSELVTLVRRAGFDVVRLDGDFSPNAPVGEGTSEVHLLARPLPAPPEALAVATWRTPPEPGFELRYAPDEVEWLASRPHEMWENLLRSEPRRGGAAAEHYPVDDPYGAERGAAAVSSYFGCEVLPDRLTFGAGVTPLLAALAPLADGGVVLAPRLTHPDFEVWGGARGAAARSFAGPLDPDRLVAEVTTLRPAVLHFDRPSFAGELLPLPVLETVARAAGRAGTVVLIDESPASYLGPVHSAVPLAGRVGNLVVLRGMTKAFSFGGLRVGFAVAGAAVAPRVRELVAPLQVGELSFRVALRVLAAGDLFGPLRARIRATKPDFVAVLERLGFAVRLGHPELPWVLLRDDEGEASRMLGAIGVRALRPAPPPHRPDQPTRLLQLFVPLSDDRMAQFLRLTRGEAAPRPTAAE